MSIAVLYDERFLDHRDPMWDHPECPERLVAVQSALVSAGLPDRTVARSPREATREEILRVHEEGYFDRLARELPGREGRLDPDTFYSSGTWTAALLAAGGGVDLALDVHRGTDGLTGGLALVRPPGHHAEADRGRGFCIFNNIAIAAEALRAEGVGKIAIVDWDVHHGNGTQHAFEDRSDVLYLSSHRYPYFPGSGHGGEMGRGEGLGYTLNVPLPAGCGDGEYLAVFDRLFLPMLDQFAPEALLVSAGFDTHEDDPLGGMRVTDECFRLFTRKLRRVAEDHCGGRQVIFLEGGYDLDAMGRGCVGLLEEVLREEVLRDEVGDTEAARAEPHPAITQLIDELRRRFADHWDL